MRQYAAAAPPAPRHAAMPECERRCGRDQLLAESAVMIRASAFAASPRCCQQRRNEALSPKRRLPERRPPPDVCRRHVVHASAPRGSLRHGTCVDFRLRRPRTAAAAYRPVQAATLDAAATSSHKRRD